MVDRLLRWMATWTDLCTTGSFITEDLIRLKSINHITYNVKGKDKALRRYEVILGIKQIPNMVNGYHLYRL